MAQATTIGLDIAKQVFQAHGADAAAHMVFRKRLTRTKLLGFFASHPPCLVAMEACAGSHYWGREIGKLGHNVRLIPPAYVKPFEKRKKNDVADAEAICEAAQRPSMRFVPVKSEDQQASSVVFRARDMLVHQRTQCVNALRSHLSEYGYTFAQGITHVPALIDHVEDPNTALPDSARSILKILIETFTALEAQIKQLDVEINRRAKAEPVARRLMTIPGVGPISATAITALVSAPESFRTGRDFAAWLGLTPLQKSTGGKQKLGATSKRGERTIRRLLILGASAVIRQVVTVDALKAASAEFTTMRGLAMRFRGLLRGGKVEKLDVWLKDARGSGIYGMQRFARALRHDIEAVRNAVLEPWSNGQTEGQINRLKTLKRAMYGHAGVDLVRARLLPLHN